jgi:hypothetical protein
MEDLINIICNYFIHSFILFTFLSIFFIFFISKLTKETFNTEITHLIHNAMKSLKIPKLSNNFNLNTLINAFSKPDLTTKMYNELLLNSLVIVNILLWTGLIITVSILKYYNWNTLELSVISLENLLIFSVVGIIEYLFFTQIAFNFVPVEPSFIKSQLIKILQSQ